MTEKPSHSLVGLQIADSRAPARPLPLSSTKIPHSGTVGPVQLRPFERDIVLDLGLGHESPRSRHPDQPDDGPLARQLLDLDPAPPHPTLEADPDRDEVTAQEATG